MNQSQMMKMIQKFYLEMKEKKELYLLLKEIVYIINFIIKIKVQKI